MYLLKMRLILYALQEILHVIYEAAYNIAICKKVNLYIQYISVLLRKLERGPAK